jgi:hypothetical protein
MSVITAKKRKLLVAKKDILLIIMDPLAIAAVVGLVFAGKRLADGRSESPESGRKPLPATTKPLTRRDIDLMGNSRNHSKDYTDFMNTTPDVGRRVGDWRLQPKEAVPNLQDMTQTNGRFPFGQPVYDMYNRQYVTNKMNNVNPLESPNTVGPGLGVGPNVKAAGGFHDYFRALPNNINEEKLTTIEGRPGPPSAVVPSGGAGGMGEITHNASQSKTVYRAPGAFGGGGAQGAMVAPEGRPDNLKTRKTTRRQETGLRTDTLSEGPPSYFVQQPYAGGKTSYTDKTLTRTSGDRSKPDRAGNGGRMNVRNDPVNQVGAATQLRPEAEILPVPSMGTTGSNQGRGTQPPQYDDPLNEQKSNPNPRASSSFLDIAIQQLEKNPLAYSLARPPPQVSAKC